MNKFIFLTNVFIERAIDVHGDKFGYTNTKVKRFFQSCRSLLWCSEPIRLSNYKSKIIEQSDIFNRYFSFDEGECHIYRNITNKPCDFIPQAAFEQWYYPLYLEKKRLACFVGSVGGKWANRQHMLNRARAVLGDNLTIAQGNFNIAQVNNIYNQHHFVLNLGLYIPELGPPTILQGYGYQQRIFETIMAGSIPFTNWPADYDKTPSQQKLFSIFDNMNNIVFYDNERFEAMLKVFLRNSAQRHLERMQDNVIAIRNSHTYLERIKLLFSYLVVNNYTADFHING